MPGASGLTLHVDPVDKGGPARVAFAVRADLNHQLAGAAGRVPDVKQIRLKRDNPFGSRKLNGFFYAYET